MLSEHRFTSLAITLAAAAMLSVTACKKASTTSPDDAAPVDADADDAAEEPADSEDADEVDAADDDDSDGVTALSKANFDETISEHFDEVSDCYVTALMANDKLQGILNAEFTIGADGKLTSLVMLEDSTLNDEGLRACVEEAARSWSFGVPASGEMTLRYGFKLAPK